MQRLGIVLVLVAAAAVAWCLWSGLENPEPIAHPAPTTPTVSVAATASADVPPPVPEPAARTTAQDGTWWAEVLTAPEPGPVAASDDDARAVVLRGRLTVRQQPWRHPANVELRVTRSWLDSVVPIEVAPSLRTPQRDEPRTRTDEQGYFAFRLLPGNTEIFFLIGHGTEWHDYQKVAKVPLPGGEADLGDVLVDQRGSITGIVAGGGGGGGTEVRAIADPLLDGLAGFDEVRAARAEGTELFRVPGTLRGGPVPAWAVQRDRFLPFPRAVADGSGRFRIDGVRPGNHDVVAHDRYGHGRSAGIQVAPGRTTDIGTLTLRDRSHVQLTFVDERNQPWVGAGVAFVHSKAGYGDVAVRTDARGGIATSVAEPAASTLLFALPGGGPWLPLPWRKPDLFEQLAQFAADVDSCRIVVPRPAELVVVLADAAGALLTGGTVRCFTAAESFRRIDRALPNAMQPRETSPGRYVGALPCPAVIVAAVRGHAPAIATVDGPSHLAIKMLPLQSMTVHVHDLEGRPIAGALVRAQVHDNPDLVFPGSQWSALCNDRVPLGRTDEQGRLQAHVWPTFFSFQATHEDYAASAGPKVMATPGGRYDLMMLGGGSVLGILTVEHRPAPRGLRVRARQQPPAGHPVADSGFLDERLAVTGEGGAFALRDLVAGLWELSPELPAVPSPAGARPAAVFPPRIVQLDQGQELHVVLSLQTDHLAAAQITGIVTQNGAPLASALVRLRELAAPEVRRPPTRPQRSRRASKEPERFDPDAGLPWSARCETDAFGDFRFRNLRPDSEYELRVDVPSGGRLQFLGRRLVRAGTLERPLAIDWAIPAGAVQLTCSVGATAFANRMLRLRQVLAAGAEGACYELLLDGNGQAFVADLPLGKWTIEPMHGGRCEPGEFELLPGQAPSLLFQVPGR